MSLAIDPPDNPGAGAGVGTGLGTATAAVLVGMIKTSDIQSLRVVVRVAATGAFKIDLMFTPDGTNFYVGKTVSSATVVVDGGVANYTSSAEMITDFGFWNKIQIYQSTGSDIDYAYEVRIFSEGR